MCLIMYRENGHLNKQDFETALESNGDGLGIMYVKNGRVIAKKSVLPEHREQLFNEVDSHRGKKLLHMRLATHGNVDSKTCHPFKICDIDDGDRFDLYMMHNGILSVDNEEGLSDTQVFIKHYIQPVLKRNPDLIHEKGFQKILSEMIGSFNKLTFIDSYDRVVIINENQGEWRKGCWLSSPHYVDNYSYYGGYYGGNYKGYTTTSTKTTTTSKSEFEEKEVKCDCCSELFPKSKLNFSESYDMHLCDDCLESWEGMTH